ncbi:MAG: type IX secretion system membrane protein PorP/SprF [Adhaeribacter sp.]
MRSIFTLFFLLSTTCLLAQQRAQYSNFALNNYLQNPAITGIEDYTDIKFGFRNQWVGIEGAPRTYYLSAHMPINKKSIVTQVNTRMRNGRKVRTISQRRDNSKGHKPKPHQGLGLIAESDKSGAISRSNLNLTYAYHLPVSRHMKLAAGAGAGVLNYSINTVYLNLDNNADAVLGSPELKSTQLDLSLGLWAYSQNFFGGVSASQFVSKKRDFIKSLETQSGLQPHFFISGGYKVNVSPALSLVPSVLVKLAQPSPLSADINLKAMLYDRVYVGGTYRKEDALSAIAGMNVSSTLALGYAYDATTSELSPFSQGSHEVVLNIKLFNRSKSICPDWLW